MNFIEASPGALNPQPLIGNSMNADLLNKAELSLFQKLKNAPEDTTLLVNYAEICRCCGYLEKASETYRRLAQLEPDHPTALYFAALFENSEPPVLSPEIQPKPVPFVIIPDFLQPEEHQRLLDFTLDHERLYVKAKTGINAPSYNPALRNNLYGSKTPTEIKKQFRSLISGVLPDLLRKLRIPPFEVDKISVMLTATLGGQYYRNHIDKKNSQPPHRVLNCVYYYHKEPKAFSGGDLLMHDTNLKDLQTPGNRFTRLSPQNNCMAVFPADYYHEISEVVGDPDDFSSARFAVVCHVIEKK